MTLFNARRLRVVINKWIMQLDDGLSKDGEKPNIRPIVWVLRIALASLTIITIHYVGFFSTLSNDYFPLMSATLLKRVAWELISTLSFTSLVCALLLFVLGFLERTKVGIARFINPNAYSAFDGEGFELGRIAAVYLSVLFLTYIPFDGPFYLRTLYGLIFLVIVFLIYLVFAREAEKDTKWSRFVAPLRQNELAVRASIAFGLLVPYLAGVGLAWSMLSAEPKHIFLDSGEINAVVLDVTDTTLLIKTDNGVMLLPMHEVNKVIWSVEDSDDGNNTE